MPDLKLLSHADEPQNSGALVAVNWGDYRLQEVWVGSGSNVGNWYCLGGEYGRPRVWVDPRTEMEKMLHRGPDPKPPQGSVPLQPVWSDVLARGPVVLLMAGAEDSYRQGWRNGRKDLWDQMESYIHDYPEDGPG